MSLRTRVALLVAVTVLIASAVGGLGVALSSRRVGIDRLDQELLQDASRLNQSGPGLSAQVQINLEARRATCDPDDRAIDEHAGDEHAANEIPADRTTGSGRGPRNARLGPQFASSVQFIGQGGIVIPGCVGLPIEDIDRAIALVGTGSRLRTVSVDNARYRMLTVGAGDLGALQFARNLDITEGTLRGLFNRIIGFGVMGALLAGSIGWYLAGRTTRPVQRLSAAADRVAQTRDLGERINIDGTGEIRTLATSFNTMLESLDTSREQQRRLVQDASHELRTPLTSMRTNVELLQRHADVPADVRAQVMADIGDELAELSELAAELVESATEVDSDPTHNVPFDLTEIVIDCVERGRRRHRRDIRLAVDSSHDSIVIGDPTLIARAVTNLLNNAAKFAPADTVIEVTATETSTHVRDRGPGIDPADLPHIFDRFYRATTARSAPGSGLGLAIVKQIVDGHGGQLHVANRSGGGLEIGFDLPSGSAAETT